MLEPSIAIGNSWTELILLKRQGIDFDQPTDEVVFQLPGLTNDMYCLELREIKIGIAAPDVASVDLEWLTLKLQCPKAGLYTPNGDSIVIVPEMIGAGTILFKEFHKNNVELLRLNTKNATSSSRPLKIQFLKGTGLALSKRYVYLRLGLRQANHSQLIDHQAALDQDRFQAF